MITYDRLADAPDAFLPLTGLVRNPGELPVRNTAIGSRPPRPYLLASSIRAQLFDFGT